MKEEALAVQAMVIYNKWFTSAAMEKAMKKMGGQMICGDTAGFMTQVREAVTTEMESKAAYYIENKAAFQAEAFKIMDTNGNGSLEVEELVACLKVGSEKFNEFNTAFNEFNTDPTKSIELLDEIAKAAK